LKIEELLEMDEMVSKARHWKLCDVSGYNHESKKERFGKLLF